MSRKELLIAGLLLAVAVVGGAVIPRLLASPAVPLGIALGPGPSRSVVQAPTVSGARHHPTSGHTNSPHASAVVTPVTHVAVQPSPTASVVQSKRATTPPPTAPVAALPTAVTPPKQPPALAGRNASPPTTPPGQAKASRGQQMTPPGHMKTPPGHMKTPPGHAKTPPVHLTHASHGKPTLARGERDLPGSGHGRPVPQAASHAVDHHDRNVGHLPPHPARPAAAARHSCPKARPETRGSSGQGSHGPPAPPVTNGHGHNGNGKGSGD